MSKQRCKYCKYEWEYKGLLYNLATCPNCNRKTPIKRTKEEMELIEQVEYKKQLEREMEKK